MELIKQYTTIIKKTKQDKDVQSKRWRPGEMWLAEKKQRKRKLCRISNREREDWLQVDKFQRGLWDNFNEDTGTVL